MSHEAILHVPIRQILTIVNVTSENDLVDTFRQKLLLEQQSGKPILFVGGL